jgi:hypothetical protein
LSIFEWAILEAAFPLTESKWAQMLAVLQAMKPALVTSAAISPDRPSSVARWVPHDEEHQRSTRRTEPSVAHPETTSGLTPEALDLLNRADDGGVPMFTSQNLRRIASENGINVSDDITPNAILEELRARSHHNA